jgi:hypothetical protein
MAIYNEVSQCLIQHRAMKTYGVVKVQLYHSWRLRWVTSFTLRALYPARVPSTHWKWGLMGPRAGVDVMEKRRIFFIFQESNLGRPARSYPIFFCTLCMCVCVCVCVCVGLCFFCFLYSTASIIRVQAHSEIWHLSLLAAARLLRRPLAVEFLPHLFLNYVNVYLISWYNCCIL